MGAGLGLGGGGGERAASQCTLTAALISYSCSASYFLSRDAVHIQRRAPAARGAAALSALPLCDELQSLPPALISFTGMVNDETHTDLTVAAAVDNLRPEIVLPTAHPHAPSLASSSCRRCEDAPRHHTRQSHARSACRGRASPVGQPRSVQSACPQRSSAVGGGQPPSAHALPLVNCSRPRCIGRRMPAWPN